MTQSYVLSELFALASVRGVSKSAALAYSIDLVENADVETIWVDRDLHNNALRLISNRADKGYSICDAVSFILMRRYGITEALTTDKHFEQEGFIKLL